MSGIDELGRRCLELEQKLQYYRGQQTKKFATDSTDLSLYFDLGTGFTEEQKLHSPIMVLPFCHVEENFALPVGVRALRLDPGEVPCLVSNLAVNIGSVHPVNGIPLSNGGYLFTEMDPMFRIECNADWTAQTNVLISFDYRPISAQRDALDRMLSDELFAEYQRRNELSAAYEAQKTAFADKQEKVEQLIREREQANMAAQEWKERFEQEQTAIQQVLNSRAWRITAPVRKLGALLRRKA